MSSYLIEIVLGFVTAVMAILLTRKIYPNKEIASWRKGLIVAAAIYIIMALLGPVKDFSWLAIECGGLVIYGSMAILSKKYSTLFLAFGWGMHVCWDLFLHPQGHPGYVPSWYPGACLGFDIVIAIYIVYLYKTQKTRTVNFDSSSD